MSFCFFKRGILLHVVISLFIFRSFAQEKDLKFSHLTVANGLPNNTVNAVIKDSRGFIWFATEHGVSRYDGYSFTNFKFNEDDSLSISSNIVYSIYEDNKQRIWIASEKGLDLYNRNTDRFEKHYFQGVTIRVIYQDKKNRVWVGGDNGVTLFNEQLGIFTKPFSQLFNDSNKFYNTVSTIAEDKDGRIWFGVSDDGIYVFDAKQKKLKQYIHNTKDQHSLSSNSIRKILVDSKNQIWVATYGGGINLFRPDSGNFKRIISTEDSKGLSSNLTNCIWEDENGKLWIGTDGNGINIYDPKREVFHHFTHSPYNSGSLNNNVVRCVNGDGRGGVWIGTYAGGINFSNQNTEPFVHYKVPTFNGISSVTAFTEDEKGNLWIGTDGGGLCYFDRNKQEFTNYKHDKSVSNSLSDNRITSLLLDDKGKLWIGTYLGGLCKYDPSQKIFKKYSTHNSLSNNIIWCLLQDSNKRIWIGTNQGLNIYEPDLNKFSAYTTSNSELSNDMIRALYEDQQKRIWVGTQNGLNLFDERKEDFIEIGKDLKESKTNSNWIRTISHDSNGKLWAGTLDGGINLFDENQTFFKNYKEKEGIPDNMISGIINDSEGNVWISTGQGLARINLATNKIRHYSLSDGLQENQFNNNAFLKTKKGEFIFGGIGGFCLFVPESINRLKQNPYPPVLALTSFKSFNKEIPVNHSGSPLTKQVNETSDVLLDYTQSVLTIEYTGLNFIQPERNQYAYRLLGFENSWNYIGNKRSATYTNLSPGDYTFELKASNNEGIWTTKSLELKITITPPFWDTWWFKSIVFLLSVSLGILMYRNVKKRIRQKINTNKLIAELEIKALIAQMNPHFIFNCLTSIQELIILSKQDQAMYYLDKFSKLLRNVLQSSEKNFVPLELELTLLELYLELESLRFDKQFNYDIDVDPQIDLEEIIIPSFLIQPFVENALWHGLMNKKGDRNLSIYFKLQSENILVCKITDDGIGREEAGKIKKSNFKTGYQSLGIKIIRERFKLMRKYNSSAELKIIDEFDDDGKSSGTSVVIKIPLGIRSFTDPIIGIKRRVKKVEEKIDY